MPRTSHKPREHKTTRPLIRANVNPRPFALSKKSFYGGAPIAALAAIKNNPRHKKRPITLAEHA